jgi:hypothetical protein
MATSGTATSGTATSGTAASRVAVHRRRVAVVDPRSPASWEVPAVLPDPATAPTRDLGDVALAMALEAARLEALFSGTQGVDADLLAELLHADRHDDLTVIWYAAVTGVCAAYRLGAMTAADAAVRGEDDTFGSLASLCAHLLGWLTWCSGLPFAAPGTLPLDVATLPYRRAARGGDPARAAVAAFTEVLAARP